MYSMTETPIYSHVAANLQIILLFFLGLYEPSHLPLVNFFTVVSNNRGRCCLSLSFPNRADRSFCLCFWDTFRHSPLLEMVLVLMTSMRGVSFQVKLIKYEIEALEDRSTYSASK